MTWLALASIEEFEIVWQGNYYSFRCPEHGAIHSIPGSPNPVKLKIIFRAIKEHVEKEHKDAE